ncbi:MAG: type VI secretion system Vgr family protein, partial [Rhodoferax sp.]|uniref:type VI secretion system Vgr family protein n=1 Tax=Rhodoferax sp. TaxID=50421 RepID=UPI0032640B31
PIVTAALYNGQGEGGVAPTPAGDTSTQADTSVFDAAHDHRYSGQGNLIGTGSGGHSPVWHGAGANAHRNASAQWGIRSKEFGGASGSAGYNQLVFDDTDNQGRIQLKTTQNATELNLGHLIHTADNYRGSLRGTGAELRTDAYGAIRAGAGLLISSYQIQHSASSRDPAGDNSAGMALLKQASTLAGAFSQAASTHRTVAYASHLGAANANASSLDAQAAPLKALQTSASGMLNPRSLEQALADAAAKQTSTAEGPDGAPVPHSADALIHVAARGGLGTVAGQSLQLSNGETISLMSGQDSQYSTGGALRVHSGQAIGILAGAVEAGANGTGLQIIAAQDDIDLQAQADELKVQAKDGITVQSANGHIDWAAAKKISISTAGGANITIEGGNITTQAPGQITVHASAKVFEGPGRVGYAMPVLPKAVFKLKKQRPVSS